MKTYLLEAKTSGALEKLGTRVSGLYLHRRLRAILVSEKAPPKRFVREVRSGNQFQEYQDRWLNRSVLDELHEEYVRAAPVNPRTQQAALRRWHKVRKDRAKAQSSREAQIGRT